MSKVSVQFGNSSIELFFSNPKRAKRAVIFAAGSGGNPERHKPLLESLIECNCSVIAPYFERIVSPMPSDEELEKRISSINAALNLLGNLKIPFLGVGHSIGAALLLGFAGGQMWTKSGKRLKIEPDKGFEKLVLFTPPTGFFQAPQSLDKVKIPIQLWAGSADKMTPLKEIEILANLIKLNSDVDFRIAEGAGHFSFMNSLPPSIEDTMKNRDDFIRGLVTDVCKYAIG